MGFVGVPHYNNRALGSTFMQNISVAGGAASATTYDKQFLLKAVLDGDINPGRVFTSSYKLEDIDQAYKDMDERKTIKSMIVMAKKENPNGDLRLSIRIFGFIILVELW